MDGQVYPQPLIVPALGIKGGTHNVMYVATEHDSVYAFDADGGGTLWSKSLLGPGMTPAPSGDNLGVSPEIGVLSTPVIDRASGTIYVVATVAKRKRTSSGCMLSILPPVPRSSEDQSRLTATVSGTGADNSRRQDHTRGRLLSALRACAGEWECLHQLWTLRSRLGFRL